ncbi:MAG: rRNA maturation RNase YbeY [Ignavibacteria bacterium]|nr:rRNA maturation RNase YbeY [Ignavibacteria bacterium]
MSRNKQEVKKHTKKAILINNLHPYYKLPITHNNVRELVSKVMYGEDCPFNEIIVNFVDNRAIKKLNKKHLKHDYFTDIITFPYNDKSAKDIEGELFISLNTVKENGKIYESGYKMELSRVIIHGSLHLAGYLDKSKRQKELIREKENYYLSKFKNQNRFKRGK